MTKPTEHRSDVAADNWKRRVALVIGNSRYIQSSDALINPQNDARDIAAALTRIGFTGVVEQGDDFAVNFNQTGVPALFDLNHQRLGRALAALARAADGVGQAVIYYAGHGIEVDGENYLIPVDAKLAHARDADFELQPLSRALRTIEGAIGLRLVILDACRNNPFRTRLFRARDVSNGLRSVEPYGNVLVAYAAKHGTVSFDGQYGNNSPFATALLNHIETPGLEVVDLFREVKDDVLNATCGAQEPYLYGALGRRREYLVPKIYLSEEEIRAEIQQYGMPVGCSALQWKLLKEDLLDNHITFQSADYSHPFSSEEAKVRFSVLEQSAKEYNSDVEKNRRSEKNPKTHLSTSPYTDLLTDLHPDLHAKIGRTVLLLSQTSPPHRLVKVLEQLSECLGETVNDVSPSKLLMLSRTIEAECQIYGLTADREELSKQSVVALTDLTTSISDFRRCFPQLAKLDSEAHTELKSRALELQANSIRQTFFKSYPSATNFLKSWIANISDICGSVWQEIKQKGPNAIYSICLASLALQFVNSTIALLAFVSTFKPSREYAKDILTKLGGSNKSGE